ncbi:unnamed protein product [Prorocentrum cordatum]|nr:unnamed protein product [Polarella glacialis]
MHSANHTKRITDSKAYERNLKQLEEIRRDHPRWRADGLQDLAFRILSTSVDTTDSATHASPTTTSRPAAAAPPSTCEASSSRCQPTSAHRGAAARGSSRRLGDATPWDVASLRQRAAQPARLWDCPGAAGASFLLLDRRRGLAKVLADASPRLLVVFFRSLVDPAADGLIIADPRPVGDLLRAFEEAAALFRPAVAYSFCTARVKTGGLKYGVYQSAACGGDGWDSVDRASWLAFATPRPGLIPVTWCVNEKYWTQHIVQAERCPERWQDLDWKYGGTFWARAGERFCVGVRQAIPELSFSKLGIASSCAGSGGFSHAFGFDGVREETSLVPVSVCLGRGAKNRSRVSLNNNCGEDGFEHTGSFAARVGARALGSDEVFCVASGASGDAIFPAGGCGEQWRFDFALPPAAPADAELPREPASAQGITVCAAPHGPAFVSGGGGDCEGGLLLRTPSAAALAASVPRGRGGGEGPLFVLVEEAAPCASFLCPGVLQSRA